MTTIICIWGFVYLMYKDPVHSLGIIAVIALSAFLATVAIMEAKD